MDDPRSRAARYWADPDAGTDDPHAPAGPTPAERSAYVETAIQQALRQGAFDDLPGAGRPIPGLGVHHDPDWWIRRKIETEQLTGLGPPALSLRVEHADFAERLDALAREQDVREYVEDFNRRVVEARRQLRGGPPVVTPTHDIEAEIVGWRERRAFRMPPADPPAPRPTPRGRRPRLRRPGVRGERG